MCVWCRRPTRIQILSSAPSPRKWKVSLSPTHLTRSLVFGMWLITLSLLRYSNVHFSISVILYVREENSITGFGFFHSLETFPCSTFWQSDHSFFVLTNMVVTPKQVQSHCPEVSRCCYKTDPITRAKGRPCLAKLTQPVVTTIRVPSTWSLSCINSYISLWLLLFSWGKL